VKPQTYRVDCTNCGWHGYRRNHPLNECTCYDENAWYCRPDSPGLGCPSGANLFSLCPRCRNVRVEILKNVPFARFDRAKVTVRKTWTRQQVRDFHRGRRRVKSPNSR
jgi:hypothetical protein